MAEVHIDEKVLLNFAQKLAGNEKKIRDRALKKLRRWLQSKSQAVSGGFTGDDFLKIWKGLHYCMWMQDKPLIQEELADSLSQLIHCFGRDEIAFKFLDAFFQTQAREWNLLDVFRLDKFMMLIRRCFHQSLVLVKKRHWSTDCIGKVTAILQQSLINSKDIHCPDGLKFHLADIYLTELTKVGAEELAPEKLQLFLDPYCKLLSECKNKVMVKHVVKRVFEEIVKQAVKAAEEDEEEDDDDGADEPKSKTVRLQFDYEKLADALFQLASSKSCLGRNRTVIYSLVKKFRDLAEGILPQEEDIFISDAQDIGQSDINKAVERLKALETRVGKNQKRRERRKKKRKTSASEDEEGADAGEPQPKKTRTTPASGADGEGDNQSDTKAKKKKNKKKGMKNLEPTKGRKELTLEDAAGQSSQEPFQEESSPGVSDSEKEAKKKQKIVKRKDHITEKTRNVTPLKSSTKTKKEERNSKTPKDAESETDSDRQVTSGKVCLTSSSGKKKHNKKTTPGSTESLRDSEVGPQISPDNPTSRPAKKSSTKKKKAKSLMEKEQPLSNGIEEEIEIWVPNKKYKGKFKDVSQQEKTKPDLSKQDDNLGAKFAKFEKSPKMPSAFVKRALGKVSPKSEPKLKSKKLSGELLRAPGSLPDSGRKKVLFAMSKNMEQDYKEYRNGVSETPTMPFDPRMTPGSGILKTPTLASPGIHTPKQKLVFKKKQRKRASDLVRFQKYCKFKQSDLGH